MKLRIKKLHDDAIIPKRAYPSDAGLDLFLCGEAKICHAGTRTILPTGVSLAIPNGYYGRIAPRSGLSVRYGLDVMAGVVDASYRGEVKVVIFNSDERPVSFSNGDSIAQLIIERIALPEVVSVKSLDDTERGENGWGSSDA